MEYWQKIREKIGHDKLIVTGSSAAILDNSNRVLLQKRADKNCWGFPGGLAELEESFTETAVREVKEETGLDVQVDELIGIYSKYSHEFANGDKIQPVVAFFKCTKVGGEFYCDKKETLDLQYFAFDEKPELLNKQHEDMFNDLFDYLKNKNAKIR